MISAKSADVFAASADVHPPGQAALNATARLPSQREQPRKRPHGPASGPGKQTAHQQHRGSLPGWRQVTRRWPVRARGVKTAPRIPISSTREPGGRQERPRIRISLLSAMFGGTRGAAPCHDHQQASQPTAMATPLCPRFGLTAAAKQSVHPHGSGRQASPDRTAVGRPRPADGPRPPPRRQHHPARSQGGPHRNGHDDIRRVRQRSGGPGRIDRSLLGEPGRYQGSLTCPPRGRHPSAHLPPSRRFQEEPDGSIRPAQTQRARKRRRTTPGFGDLPTGPRRVAIYLRRSTDDEYQPFSISAQDSALGKYVTTQPGWTLVATFTDDASGATADRPGLQQALRAARAGRFDVLLVYRVDRFSRRLFDRPTAPGVTERLQTYLADVVTGETPGERKSRHRSLYRRDPSYRGRSRPCVPHPRATHTHP